MFKRRKYLDSQKSFLTLGAHGLFWLGESPHTTTTEHTDSFFPLERHFLFFWKRENNKREQTLSECISNPALLQDDTFPLNKQSQLSSSTNRPLLQGPQSAYIAAHSVEQRAAGKGSLEWMEAQDWTARSCQMHSKSLSCTGAANLSAAIKLLPRWLPAARQPSVCLFQQSSRQLSAWIHPTAYASLFVSASTMKEMLISFREAVLQARESNDQLAYLKLFSSAILCS